MSTTGAALTVDLLMTDDLVDDWPEDEVVEAVMTDSLVRVSVEATVSSLDLLKAARGHAPRRPGRPRPVRGGR